MRRMRVFVAVLLAILMAIPYAVMASDAPGGAFEVLDTEGVPVCCGTAATRLRESLAQDGVDAYPVLLDADGSDALADRPAATGMTVRYQNGDDTVERPFVLAGDLAGTGSFTLAQLVLFANCMRTGEWTELQAAAGDLNGDGGPTLSDLVLLVGWYRAENPQAPQQPYPTPDAPSPAGETLVAWFSGSGRTGRVAEVIAQELGADTFEIVPAQPYTSADLNYNDPESRVCQEHNDPSLRDVELEQAVVPEIGQYDTIFIGYPIWWGIAAWPVNTFVKANDFGNITVIPFCTSASSPLGASGANLQEIATGGNWLAGKRFQSGASEQTVADWLDTLPLD